MVSATEREPQTFSSSGEGAIQGVLDVRSEETPLPDSSEFAVFYEIERTVRSIEEGDYKRIALQFPDELLHDSVPVYRAIHERLGPQREAYVLADTSYGSCCVDEVAASHVNADVLVHYGHACLSKTSRLPVIYVFGRKHLDIKHCVDQIADYLTMHAECVRDVAVLQLRHDAGFAYLSVDLVKLLRQAIGDRYQVEYEPLKDRSAPVLDLPHDGNGNEESAPPIKLSNGSSPAPERKMIVWIGEESSTLTKLLMTSPGSHVISYSPRLGIAHEQTHLTNKLLMRRYALLQKARDADVFGILIGTLGVASYLPLLQRLRQRLKKAHKKAYTVSVGKINPSKLANFMEIECWIWVACSEGIVDSKEYLRPIITPYELELALQSEPDWTGKYIFDFQELIANVSLEDKEDDHGDEDPERPMFSLVSGKYRQAKRYSDSGKEKDALGPTTGSQELAARAQGGQLSRLTDSAAAQFLQARSYRGLDPRPGRDAPSVLEQGRSGIARGYKDDHNNEP